MNKSTSWWYSNQLRGSIHSLSVLRTSQFDMRPSFYLTFYDTVFVDSAPALNCCDCPFLQKKKKVRQHNLRKTCELCQIGTRTDSTSSFHGCIYFPVFYESLSPRIYLLPYKVTWSHLPPREQCSHCPVFSRTDCHTVVSMSEWSLSDPSCGWVTECDKNPSIKP